MGISDKPGVCQAKLCPKHGLPLEKCDCGNPDSHKKKPEEPMKEKKKK